LHRGAKDFVIESESERKRVLQKLDSIWRQTEKLTRLVNDLLDISRISGGKVELELEQIDLSLVIRDVVALFEERGEIGRSSCKLAVEVPPYTCNETMDRCVSATTTGCLIGGACRTSGSDEPGNACRVIGMVGWAPQTDEAAEDADLDDDGIDDALDNCPSQAEDRDQYEDVDGCPEQDNDRDSVLDIKDECPTQAEDADDFEDEDGCPEPDNDKDSIADGVDACPHAAEDFDDFEDADGCEELDNDKDGVPDSKDTCPESAEDKDGFADDDGCEDGDNDADGIPDAPDLCRSKPRRRTGWRTTMAARI
jgi:hypothetical protein